MFDIYIQKNLQILRGFPFLDYIKSVHNITSHMFYIDDVGDLAASPVNIREGRYRV